MTQARGSGAQGVLRLVLLTTALVLMASWAATPQALAAPAAQAPKLEVGVATRGERAIAALGAQLPAVARAYGLSGEELRHRLRNDRSLAVDEHGRLFFTCAAPSPAAGLGAGPAAAGLVPLAQTFTLHSRPGSQRIVYLDFDGHTLTGVAWNDYAGVPTISCPAWDTDGDPAVFGDAERRAIQQVWQRVAEDYAPFDVDVTTETPAASSLTRSSEADATYGMRCLISPISEYFGNFGGLAYVGVYDSILWGSGQPDYYKPALVFPEMLADDEKAIAEAASHEVGHTLGLSHDGITGGSAYYAGHGSGETGWAPIMGVGYSQNLTQWSKGEYAGADNHEDDLAVIDSYGLDVRGDDHGDSPASATDRPRDADVSATGIIEDRADVDVFRFLADAGSASFAVVPAERGPNSDLGLDLLDVSGAVLASSNPLGSLGAGFAYNLPAAGAYYLRVQGVGEGAAATGYTDYASLGEYALSGTVGEPTTPLLGSALDLSAPSTCAYASAELSGRLASDLDEPLAGHTVVVQASSGGAAWTTVGSVTTSADGTFALAATPWRTTAYRARFAGDSENVAAVSATRTVKPRVRLTTPAAPSSVARGRTFTVTSYLLPRHPAGSRQVKFVCYRYQSGAWVARKTVTATAANYSSGSRVKASFSLPLAGKWRIRASHAEDAINAWTASGYRYLTAK